jgi:hypothetical protein
MRTAGITAGKKEEKNRLKRNCHEKPEKPYK